MKIVFLDVDGVLNCSEWLENHKGKYTEINPANVELLAKLVSKTNAKIVLSSSWRELMRANIKMYNYLLDSLFSFGLSIYDMTPILKGFDRPKEIQIWLNKHSDIEEYVILDDDFTKEMYGKELGNHLVQTSFYGKNGGLGEKHIEKSIQILKGELSDET